MMAIRTLEAARAWRAKLENIAQESTDATATTLPAAFPTLKENGELVKAGTRINWNGTLKRAAVDLWDREENNPDNAPALWENLDYREGIRIIPTVITVGTAFALNELGWWGDVLYRSLLDANVWTPADHPAGWEVVDGH